MKKYFIGVTTVGLLVGSVVLAQNFETYGLGFVIPTVSGKSNVYDPKAGEIVYDSSDSTFYGRDHATSWIPLGGSTAVVPSGSVISFAGSSCPTGYLLADGSAISPTTYSSLFTAISTAHRTGDGSTTFNLPNYQGRFWLAQLVALLTLATTLRKRQVHPAATKQDLKTLTFYSA